MRWRRANATTLGTLHRLDGTGRALTVCYLIPLFLVEPRRPTYWTCNIAPQRITLRNTER